jgi:hypothetical protein
MAQGDQDSMSSENRIPATPAERAAVEALRAEVERRNEWYGLDNWSFEEVVCFVVDALEREGEARFDVLLGDWLREHYGEKE